MGRLSSMPFFPAEFFADTEHLSDDAAHAYLFLLGHAWLRGATLPNDQSALARMARVSPRRWAAIKHEILPFWITDGLFLRNRRLSKEYDFVCQKVSVNRQNGLLGGRPKSDKKLNDFNETIKPDGSYIKPDGKAPTPTLTSSLRSEVRESSLCSDSSASASKKSKPPKISSLEILKTALSEKTSQDVIDHRKAKRAPLTPRAAEGLVAAFRDHGDPERAAEAMIVNGWQGFKPEWMNSNPPRAGPINGHPASHGKLALGSQIFIKLDTPQWNAWADFYRKSKGKSPPTDPKGGWYFPTEWPPSES